MCILDSLRVVGCGYVYTSVAITAHSLNCGHNGISNSIVGVFSIYGHINFSMHKSEFIR